MTLRVVYHTPILDMVYSIKSTKLVMDALPLSYGSLVGFPVTPILTTKWHILRRRENSEKVSQGCSMFKHKSIKLFLNQSIILPQ